MKLAEYTAAAARTAIFPPERGVEYTALALCSEVAELDTAIGAGAPLRDVLSELGDVLWNIALFNRARGGRGQLSLDGHRLDEFGARLLDPGTCVELVQRLYVVCGWLAGRVSKQVRDGAETVPVAIFDKAVVDVLHLTGALARMLGSDLEQVGQANLSKLADRQVRGVLAGSGDHR